MATTYTSPALAESDKTNPLHYRQHPSGVECITITEHMNFCLGNAIKYIWRAGIKSEDATLDLKKAIWYLQRELKRLEWEAKTTTEGASAVDPSPPPIYYWWSWSSANGWELTKVDSVLGAEPMHPPEAVFKDNLIYAFNLGQLAEGSEKEVIEYHQNYLRSQKKDIYYWWVKKDNEWKFERKTYNSEHPVQFSSSPLVCFKERKLHATYNCRDVRESELEVVKKLHLAHYRSTP